MANKRSHPPAYFSSSSWTGSLKKASSSPSRVMGWALSILPSPVVHVYIGPASCLCRSGDCTKLAANVLYERACLFAAAAAAIADAGLEDKNDNERTNHHGGGDLHCDEVDHLV